jgi:hypothetical protein
MKPKFHRLLEQCIEDGVYMGLQRAHKHSEEVSTDHIAHHVILEVMNELSEWFDFEESGNDTGS